MAGCLLPALHVEVEMKIIELLSPNEILCTVRLVNKAAAAQYRGPEQRPSVRLSQRVPHHAFAHRSTRAWIRTLPLRRRLKLLCLTAASGDLDNLVVAAVAAGCVLRDKTMEAAAAAGHIHVCQWLQQQGGVWGEALRCAAEAGRGKTCEWLLANGCPLKNTAVCAAARGGHIGLMEWLREQLRPAVHPALGFDLVAAVARGCDLPTLQRFYSAWRDARRQRQQQQAQEAGADQQQQLEQQEEEQRDNDSCNDEILVAACCSRTPDWPEKVAWLEAQGCQRPDWAASQVVHETGEAAAERLRCLVERGYPLEELAVEAAAGEGNVAALENLLKEAGGDTGVVNPDYMAATGGHLAALQLLSNVYSYPVDVFRCLVGSAAEGHLHVVSWLVDTFGLTAADLQRNAVRPAAMSGNMELVDWLVGRGCDFSREINTLAGAANGGCKVMLERLVELGCRMPDDGGPYKWAGVNGDLATLGCLRSLGCPWGPEDFMGILVTKPAARRYGACPVLPALRWLVEAGRPVNRAAALEVARGSWFLVDKSEVVAWLEEGLQRSQQQGR